MQVFIKYNPYKLETKIEINGETVKGNSIFHEEVEEKEIRFQEWFEYLPGWLHSEWNDESYQIAFHGITPDFDDLQLIVDSANKNGFDVFKRMGNKFEKTEHINAGKITFSCEYIPSKDNNSEDKIPVIKKIFEDIQSENDPFDDLRNDDLIKNAFEKAIGSEFSVNVIATMSAGKSTLINSMLRRKIMPAKNKACTATITSIRDCNCDKFSAKAFNLNNELLSEIPNLTY